MKAAIGETERRREIQMAHPAPWIEPEDDQRGAFSDIRSPPRRRA